MKRLVVLICVLATFSLSAQEGRHEHGRQGARMMNDLSPEQTATLKTKKMTLGLDLTEDQQEKNDETEKYLNNDITLFQTSSSEPKDIVISKQC